MTPSVPEDSGSLTLKTLYRWGTVVLILGFVTACRERQAVQRPHEDPFTTAPVHTSYDIVVRFTDSVTTKAVLRSAVARMFADKQETTLGDTVIVEFFSVRSQRRVALLTADSAVIDDRTKNMIAIGSVRVWSDSTRTMLETERLLWENKRERLSSTDDVKIVSPTETIYGTGFESDQFLTDYRIYNVRGTHKP
ncbi:MAG TPA: LPS export ABC transporter periplasmic protein LptC [Bacteroidetes bacterium]|nr:LPS export ABC transporter periplasmic protein LptC [Bacteroidota bacterium]